MGGSVGAGIGNGISEKDGGDGMLTSGELTDSPIVGIGGGVGFGIGNGTSDIAGSDGIDASGMFTDRPSVGSAGGVGSGIRIAMSEKSENEQALKSQLSPKCCRRPKDQPAPTQRA